ncbi:hypothetical protein GGR56DRAFT_8381 [Xylariaceae sp. FL0804]|nr:hypothetical protein GGR56DRAFT_8381 [Xylariaceae sp. FL0804]
MDLLGSVFNHLVLPPRVPDGQDEDLEGISRDILQRVIRACRRVQSLSTGHVADAYSQVQSSLHACLVINRGDRLDKTILEDQFCQLSPEKLLVLHVLEQNAALLIRQSVHEDEEYVEFEAFEASAMSEKVLEATHALQWDFPGRAVRISKAQFDTKAFREALAAFLEQASAESLYSLQAQARKAKVDVAEIRDTTDPALITQMLMSLLEAMGCHSDVSVIRKRVRDEVNLGRRAEIPWRRLPLWLVLRVSIQRQLMLRLGPDTGRTSYKLLMVVLLSELLKQSAGQLSPELAVTLRAKLCRRMAKLEVDSQAEYFQDLKLLFEQVATDVQSAVNQAISQIDSAWNAYKQRFTKQIPRLPKHAPESDIRLSMINSGQYLDDLLRYKPPEPLGLASLDLPSPLDHSIRETQNFMHRMSQLAAIELAVHEGGNSTLDTLSGKEKCLRLSKEIDRLFDQVGSTYDSNPEQMSSMVLALFTLWTRLDESAIAICPLLRDHRPAFRPELLDVLQLLSMRDMTRLHDIQEYLATRQAACRYNSILDVTSQNCLAVRYVEQSDEMRNLMLDIQEASDEAYEEKKEEWENACDEYDEHTEGYTSDICRCSWINGQLDVHGCTKCWHGRARKRMRIQIHEDFLPEDDPARSAIVFELFIPTVIALYRDATWRILSVLAHPGRPMVSAKPEVELEKCEPLEEFNISTVSGCYITLASTIKCFSQTHYKFNAGKAPLSRVALPFAAKFKLYDRVSKIWVEDLSEELTLQHLCGVYIPRSLRDSVMPDPKSLPTLRIGPSSYRIQASQSQCPSDISIHEFSACQKLLAGNSRCWPNILVEMASSNINLSGEETTMMLSQLAVQAGPKLPGQVLRMRHIVFKDEEFVERLSTLIEKRLHAILANWREHNCMGLLITLCLRLLHLSSGPARARAMQLLKIARNATLGWTAYIRGETQKLMETGAMRRIAQYGLYAALLCRRTFSFFVETRVAVDAEELTTWISASLALQENLVTDLGQLSQATQSMLIRDGKMAYQLTQLIQDAVEAHPSSVVLGIRKTMTNSPNESTSNFSAWCLLASPNNRWIVATASESSMGYKSTFHLNYMEGHLLVNGKPRGKLPVKIANDPNVQYLFGERHLLTYPSAMSGMSHQLNWNERGQEIHFGIRDSQVVVRTFGKDTVHELVSRERFTGTNCFDLPSELVDHCVHWLNLKTRCLEIRRAAPVSAELWNTRPRDWIVDVPSRRATRGNTSHLVDPHSKSFRLIADVFESFEQPRMITVFQPQNGRLRVELRHLDLQFFANWRGLLECQQLKAEISQDQDAGTWYGLDSKLVLQDTGSSQRSIIVPIASERWLIKRRGLHVSVSGTKANEYGRYLIDQAVGRLTCPPEPRLLYTKAFCHAVTSFCLPDPLTKRTGTEEACEILRSGAAHPWSYGPAYKGLTPFEILLTQREYYPPPMKRLQRVVWNEDLTTTIQHDGLDPLLRAIRNRFSRLGKFDSAAIDCHEVEPTTHLCQRGHARRQLYERSTQDICGQYMQDLLYRSRDRRTSPESSNVYEICRIIATGSPVVRSKTPLLSLLEGWEIIGGFHGNDDSSTTTQPLISQIDEPVNEQWGAIVTACRKASQTAPLLFRMGLLAFNPNQNMDAVRSLVAFALIDEVKAIEPPLFGSFMNFRNRDPPHLELLRKVITPAHSSSSSGRTPEQHDDVCDKIGRKFSRHVLNQWPVPAAELSTGEMESQMNSLIPIAAAMKYIKTEWERIRGNIALEKYATDVQRILDTYVGTTDHLCPHDARSQQNFAFSRTLSQSIPSISQDIVRKKASHQELPPVQLLRDIVGDDGRPSQSPENHIPPELSELEAILQEFGKSSSQLRQQYTEDLQQSLQTLKSTDQEVAPSSSQSTLEAGVIVRALDSAHERVKFLFKHVWESLTANDGRSKWLRLGGLWPCSTPVEVLQLLRSSSSHEFGEGMMESLVAYGLAITHQQRLERMLRAWRRGDNRALADELRSPGHTNWSPIKIPDWLLLEIECDILIRPEQVDVAKAILEPSSGMNSVLQMNMGKGKTSCIVPMVVAILANGKNLSRLIVPKALLLQTAQTAQSRLGGLVGRKVCHVPFSRKTPLNDDMLGLYEAIHRGTLKSRGLILTCHEHLLSYKLGGWQSLADDKTAVARPMIAFQNWLDEHCRDVLDECDFTLSVKTQLNYPSGPEMPVDGHPFRWHIAQGLLGIVENHLSTLQSRFPKSIIVLRRPRSFPLAHFLRTDAEHALQDHILRSICSGRAAFLRSPELKFPKKQELIRRFLTQQNFDEALLEQIADVFDNRQAASKTLLLVRGLLINNILLLCLSKRWNVQYGLHPERHPVAVPYEAKGVPSEQAEFGHPDVAILFTCLSFYFTGLSYKQFIQSLQLVLRSDDPAAQYESWASGCHELPESLRHWNVINIDDGGQMEQLWLHLRNDRVVLDHYMNNFVFPAHARQFEIKLQASAWDIPLFRNKNNQRTRTTGFSGTNDNRMMLPLTIRQDDLPSLKHTSAEVLSYLLQKRNRTYHLTASTSSGRWSEQELLHQLSEKSIRLLIDAGAYILEMDNKTLASAWLKADPAAKAAIYFGPDNRTWVHFRGEAKQDLPLLASPFADDLTDCVVYLDEAHTRGVDLKLPANAHGALTLALKQTKDYTVQAAMRLRQLRTTQSVSFFAPPQVHQSIVDFCHPPENQEIDSSHVISWLLEQTCQGIQDFKGLHTAQGLDFCQRTDAIWRYPDLWHDQIHRRGVLRTLRQPERLTLEEMYGRGTSNPNNPSTQAYAPQLQEFVKKLSSHKHSGPLQIGAMEEVEQEREVQVQVEQVRQVQQPVKFKAHNFPGLHPFIQRFAQTGTLEDVMSGRQGSGFEHAFACVGNTSLGERFGVHRTESRLYVSTEFGRTIKAGKDRSADNFMRPVEWILWCPDNQTAMVLIPEEAEELIPILRTGSNPTHLLTYAAPVTKAMLPFNSFNFYCIPELSPDQSRFPDWFRIELGILAGRLYVSTSEWDMLAQYLRPDSSSNQGSPDLARFAEDPAAFCLEWLAMRRKAQDVIHTPMGYICTGRELEEGHAFRQLE